MKPLIPSQIRIGVDGRVGVENPFWRREVAKAKPIQTLVTNGSCQNTGNCTNSTNTNICDNYQNCGGSKNGTCWINEETPPVE